MAIQPKGAGGYANPNLYNQAKNKSDAEARYDAQLAFQQKQQEWLVEDRAKQEQMEDANLYTQKWQNKVHSIYEQAKQIGDSGNLDFVGYAQDPFDDVAMQRLLSEYQAGAGKYGDVFTARQALQQYKEKLKADKRAKLGEAWGKEYLVGERNKGWFEDVDKNISERWRKQAEELGISSSEFDEMMSDIALKDPTNPISQEGTGYNYSKANLGARGIDASSALPGGALTPIGLGIAGLGALGVDTFQSGPRSSKAYMEELQRLKAKKNKQISLFNEKYGFRPDNIPAEIDDFKEFKKKALENLDPKLKVKPKDKVLKEAWENYNKNIVNAKASTGGSTRAKKEMMEYIKKNKARFSPGFLKQVGIDAAAMYGTDAVRAITEELTGSEKAGDVGAALTQTAVTGGFLAYMKKTFPRRMAKFVAKTGMRHGAAAATGVGAMPWIQGLMLFADAGFAITEVYDLLKEYNKLVKK